MELEWIKTKDYLYAVTKNFKFEKKLAMFDLDSTLIKPKIGKRGNGIGFPIDENDWTQNYSNVKNTIQHLSKNGFSIIIISNQGGMALGKQTFEIWTKKLNQICKEFNVDMHVFCAVDHNKYRKPNSTWLYEFVPNDILENLNRKESFYCGDACGRKNDFSDTDYKFALNCMVKFKTPENLFLGEFQKLPIINYPNLSEIKNQKFEFTPINKEMILMVGLQGSGKSFVANKLKIDFNYEIVNQDTFKTKDKCISYAKEYMMTNKSLVIDQTNPDEDTRKQWITLATKYGYKVRAILMTTSRELSKHNNYFRHLSLGTKVVPEIAYRIYSSKFKKPVLKEGYDEILEMSCGRPNNYNYFLYLY